MKILVVTYSFPPQYSGAAIQSKYLSSELIRQGVELDIVLNNFNNKTTIEKNSKITFYKFCSNFEYNVGKLWILRNFIYILKTLLLSLKNDYKIILFISFSSYDTWILPILKFFKRKTILQLTLAGSDDPLTFKNRRLGFIFFPLFRYFDKIVPCSTELKELTLKSGIIDEKINLIPFGVDLEKFTRLKLSDKEILKEKLGYSRFKYVFLAVGQVEARKGYDFMIKSWKYINREYPNSILIIAGPNNNSTNIFYQNLIQYIQSEKIDNVQFIGKVNNINELMRISDCLLHCALREGLPNTLLEASIASVPIVCRRMEGVTSDIIINPNIGRECITDDPNDFANLVFAIFRERNINQISSDFEILKDRFGIEQVANKYINIFNDLINYA